MENPEGEILGTAVYESRMHGGVGAGAGNKLGYSINEWP